MIDKTDKKALWQTVCNTVEAAVGAPMYFTLNGDCYLDSVEQGVAIVAACSSTLQGVVQRKARNVLELAFTEVLKRPMKVRVVVGHSRLFEKAPNEPPMTRNIGGNPELDELAILHDKYGDIMGIVDNHPLFRKACTPTDKNGWGIFPQLLTNACKDYGVMAVLKGLRYTANRPSVVNPRAFFFNALKKGQFGHRLVVGASVVG